MDPSQLIALLNQIPCNDVDGATADQSATADQGTTAGKNLLNLYLE